MRRVGEKDIDAAVFADIVFMWRNSPSIKIARDSFLSMVLCGPFSFGIPKLGIVSGEDMSRIISRHWMPWQRSMFDWIKILGLCPYYMEKISADHYVPVVPGFEDGTITVCMNNKYRKQFHWYWCEAQSEKKHMYWIDTEYSPTQYGQIQSQCASLLKEYKTIIILTKSLETASAQNANVSHVVEHHPAAGTAKNDELTELVANFGEKYASLSKARQDRARAQEIRVRKTELVKQLKEVHQSNMNVMFGTHTPVLNTDQELYNRFNTGFGDRLIPLPADRKYVSPGKASVVAELDKYIKAFEFNVGAIIGFPMELIQSSGSSRSQNIKGAERFANEQIKQQLSFQTYQTKVAIIIAYRKHFDEALAKVNFIRRGGDAAMVADLITDLDVEVIMSCTPMISYEGMKQMWLDGIISKDDFAHHAFHMNSLPMSQISVTTWPDKMPKDLLISGKEPANKKIKNGV